jgi:phage host-nuclease inhibitor protein Gam
MAKTRTRIKSAAAAVDVPQSRESAAAAIAAIGIANRELQRINADMNDALAACKEAYEMEAEPYKLKIQELTDGLQIFAEANRATLTNNYKVKTVALTSGEITWRMNPPSVRLTDTEENVIAACEAAGLEEFIRRTPSLNREAIKANPDEARHVPGLKIGQSEAFVVTPFEAELSEAA